MDPLLQEIVPELRKGSRHAFETLFKSYSPKLLSFCGRYFNNDQDCEEIVQEVFIKLWNNRENIREADTFESFLYTIAKNHIYNVLRKNIHRKAFDDYNLSHLLKESFNIEEEQNFAELFIIVKSITKSLPEQRRKVFVMSRFKGFTNKEIAKELNISINTVETHIKLALKKFREVLKQNEYLLSNAGLFILLSSFYI